MTHIMMEKWITATVPNTAGMVTTVNPMPYQDFGTIACLYQNGPKKWSRLLPKGLI